MSLTRRILARVAQAPLTKALPHDARPTLRLFYLDRLQDQSGVSGAGIVACGVVFPNGQVAQCWLTDTTTVTIFDSLEAVKDVHGHAGATRILIQDIDIIGETEME
jgi:hypothetical protein